MGTNDLAKELHAEHVPGRQPLLTGLGLCLLAARATGKVILDGVYNDIKDADGLRGRVRAGPRAGLRRQDADPPEPGRAVQPACSRRRAEEVDDARAHHRRLRGGRGRRARASSPSTAA